MIDLKPCPLPEFAERRTQTSVTTVNTLPNADIAPEGHASWETIFASCWQQTPGGGMLVDCKSYRCKRCGYGAAVKSSYCPRCYAKMDLGG